MAKYKNVREKREEANQRRAERIEQIMEENELKKAVKQETAEQEKADFDAMKQEEELGNGTEQESTGENQENEETRKRPNRASNKLSDVARQQAKKKYNKMAQNRAKKHVDRRVNRGKTGKVNNQQTGKPLLKDSSAYRKATGKQAKKAATKTAAKSGAKVAGKAGVKAAGCGGSLVVALIIVLLVIGLISFIFNMPEEISGKIRQFLNDKWLGAKIGLNFVKADVGIGAQNLLKTAQYLDSMGYDLIGLGFMEPTSVDEKTEESTDREGSQYYYFRLEAEYDLAVYDSTINIYYNNSLVAIHDKQYEVSNTGGSSYRFFT